uniref:Uncharacterized protein n=1 Tax=Haemonchus placei TaxID=6290 RepID=A0A0N4WT29_HAEPC
MTQQQIRNSQQCGELPRKREEKIDESSRAMKQDGDVVDAVEQSTEEIQVLWRKATYFFLEMSPRRSKTA